MTAIPRPPANAEPFVGVLGVDLAVDVFLTFGGAELVISPNPTARARLVQLVGFDKARALADLHLPRRVPLVKPWVAQVLHAKGLSTAEIARRMHASDVAVRGWLAAGTATDTPRDTRQMRLL